MIPPSDLPGHSDPPPSDPPARPTRLPALPLAIRIGLLVIGWILLLVGVAGLFVPGLQGCLTIVAAAAILSLVSEGVYRLLRRAFRGRPRGWRRVLRFRAWLHRKLSRHGRRR